MPLMRLIYFSENLFDPALGSVLHQLKELLSTSNRNNKRFELTGALVFDDRWFLQTLEGDRETVWRTFERIRADERHYNVAIAEFVEVDERIFGSWWMGVATRCAKTEHIFQPFLQQGHLDPRLMTAHQMLSMMVALSQIGLTRALAVRHAA